MKSNFSRIWRTLFLGQFLSLLLCGTGVTSQLLQDNYNLHIPTAQSFLNYVILCLIFTTWLACKSGDNNLCNIIKTRGWKYFILAVIDVEANFLVVKAYQYTTITSVQLLDCFTIPTVLLLSWLWIKVQYGIVHIIGVCLSLIGIGCLIYSDLDESTKQIEAKNRFLGDMLCILGATLYGVSNVAQEYVVKSFSIVEFLGMIGLFGSIVSGTQLMILERSEVESLFHLDKYEEISLILGFAACLLLLYITMPLVLQVSNSTSVNISILSADFYALLIGLYLFNFKFNWLYFVSFALIIFGVTTFNLVPAPSKIDPNPSNLTEFETNSSTSLSPSRQVKANVNGDTTGGRLTLSNSESFRYVPTTTMTSGQFNQGCDVLPNVLEFAQPSSQSFYNTFPQPPPQMASQSNQIYQQESDLIASIEKNRYHQLGQIEHSDLGKSTNYHQHRQQQQHSQPEQQQYPSNRIDFPQQGNSPKLIWEDRC